MVVIVQIIHDTPSGDPASSLKRAIFFSSSFTEAFFLIDTLLQFYVYGLSNYFKKADLSNWIEIILNVISVAYFTSLKSLFTVKILYSLRCLRISYWISLASDKNRTMRVTIRSFKDLIPKIVNLLLALSLIYGFFANIAVRLYHDQMWECVNYNPNATIRNNNDCFQNGGDWIQLSLNFSNFGNALLYIFLFSST